MRGRRQDALVRSIFDGLLLLALFPLSSEGADKAMITTECQVVWIANSYVAEHYPDFDLAHYKPLVHDKGAVWLVDYEIPDGVIGGTPVVEIEKGANAFIRSYHTQ
jgi:hypothetical protein